MSGSTLLQNPPSEPSGDEGTSGGFWGTPEETQKFLHLETEQEVWDLANRNLSARRCSGIFDERDVQRIGKRKFRIWCCKPTIAGNRRPRINERKA